MYRQMYCLLVTTDKVGQSHFPGMNFSESIDIRQCVMGIAKNTWIKLKLRHMIVYIEVVKT